MPTFFFHVDGEERDIEGNHYDNLAKAKCAAVEAAGSRICKDAGDFWDTKEWGMTVSDKDNLTLFSLNFYGTEAASILGR